MSDEMFDNPVLAALRAQQERHEGEAAEAAEADDGVVRVGEDAGVRFVDEDDAEAAPAPEGDPAVAGAAAPGKEAAAGATAALDAKDASVEAARARAAKDADARPSADQTQLMEPVGAGAARSGDAGETRVMEPVARQAAIAADQTRLMEPVAAPGAAAGGQAARATAASAGSAAAGGADADTSGIDVLNVPQPRAAAGSRRAEWAPTDNEVLARIVANVETVIVGKREAVELVVLALVAGGHVLIEDMPGTGKTSLVSALAKSIDCGFRRIQFTPDVMPSDISGFSIFNQKTRDFEFRPGAVMTNIVLADEVNRASAKTQSAMLEAMEERQVTVDGETHRLAEPFMVLATQNPIEQYGTYPLPEAQLDRFLIKLSMGYLKMDEEVRAILGSDAAKAAIKPVASGEDVLALREQAAAVRVAPAVARYAVQVASATRTTAECAFGASPRGSKALVALARAHALLRGRSYVSPDDVKYLAPFVLCHRIALTHEAKMEGRTPEGVISSILETVAVPSMTAAEAQEL